MEKAQSLFANCVEAVIESVSSVFQLVKKETPNYSRLELMRSAVKWNLIGFES